MHGILTGIVFGMSANKQGVNCGLVGIQWKQIAYCEGFGINWKDEINGKWCQAYLIQGHYNFRRNVAIATLPVLLQC